MPRLLPILLLLAQTGAYGQFVQGITVQLGVSDSQVDYLYDPQPSFDPSGRFTGFASRISTELVDNEYFRLNPGAGFFQRGLRDFNKLTFGGTPQETKLTASLNYLSFDITLKGRYPLGKFVPYVFIGPRMDVLTNGSAGLPYYDQLGGMNRTMYGLRYGGGLTIELGPCQLFAEWTGLSSANDMLDETADVLTDSYGDVVERTVRISDRTTLIMLGMLVRITGNGPPQR